MCPASALLRLRHQPTSPARQPPPAARPPPYPTVATHPLPTPITPPPHPAHAPRSFPDQFIMPTETWQWKLGWSSLVADDAPPSPKRDAHAPPLVPGPATVSVAEKEGLRTITLGAGELGTEQIAQLSSLLPAEPSISEGGAVLHLLLTGPLTLATGDAAAALRAYAELTSCLETLPLPTLATVTGAVSAVALDLALACGRRLGTADTSVTLSGWQDKMVPGARVWQLARSAGVGRLAWLLLAPSSADASELIGWGALDATVADADAAGEFAQGIADSLPLSAAGSALSSANGTPFPSTPALGDADDLSAKGGALALPRPPSSSALALPRFAIGASEGANGPPPGVSSLSARRKWLEHWVSETQSQDWLQRTGWLLSRLPQLEPASSLPLLKQHLPDMPAATTDKGLAELATLHVDRRDRVVIVTIDRPARANAYDASILNTLEQLGAPRGRPTARAAAARSPVASATSRSPPPRPSLLPPHPTRPPPPPLTHTHTQPGRARRSAGARGRARDRRHLLLLRPSLLLRRG